MSQFVVVSSDGSMMWRVVVQLDNDEWTVQVLINPRYQSTGTTG